MEIGKKASTATKGEEEAREIRVERRKKTGEDCTSFGQVRTLAEELRVVFWGRRIKGYFELSNEN